MKVKSTLPQWLKIQKNPYTAPTRTYGKQGSKGTGLHAGTSKLARRTSTSECALTSRENDYSLSHAASQSRKLQSNKQQTWPFKNMHHTKRRVVLGGRQHQAARWQKPTVKADSPESPLVSQFTVVLTKQLPSSPLLGRRYPLQGVGRAYRDLQAQSCTKSSFTSAGQYTKQLS